MKNNLLNRKGVTIGYRKKKILLLVLKVFMDPVKGPRVQIMVMTKRYIVIVYQNYLYRNNKQIIGY